MGKPTLKYHQLNAALYEFIRRDQRLNPTHRLVVMEVLDHDFARPGTGGKMKKGEAWPSQNRIAGQLGISRRTVYSAVRAATRLGYWETRKIRTAKQVVLKYVIQYEQIHEWMFEALEARGKDCSTVREVLARANGKELLKKLPNPISQTKTTERSASASRTRIPLLDLGEEPEHRPARRRLALGLTRIAPEDEEDFERYQKIKRAEPRLRRSMLGQRPDRIG
jgi:DNA-binding transcriptional MocR family regulator